MLLFALACQPQPDGLARPNRLALQPDGTVYVSDFHNDRIVVFDAGGQFVRTFGEGGLEHGELWRVTAMTVASDGALVVANRRPETDEESSDNRFELKRFVDGEEESSIQLDGRTLQPDGWVDAVVQRGEHYVIADSTHGELVEIDADGRRVGRFGGVPRPDAAPSFLLADGETLWVVEQHRHRISQVGPGGDERALLAAKEGEEASAPRFPSALGLCRAGGWLAVADFGQHRIQRYSLQGELLAEWAPTPAGPDRPVQLMDLAVSPDCSLIWAVDSKGDRILATTPDGRLVYELSQW
jgi:sugar lactone lactonase YvrE